MNFSLKPNPLIAVWLPGFTTFSAIVFFGGREEISCLFRQSPSSAIVGAFSFAAVVLSFVVGNLLDAVRDLLEHGCDRVLPKLAIKWGFFVSGEKDKIENIEEWFFTYYELDANLALGILLIFLLSWFSIITVAGWIKIAMSCAFIIFTLSAVLMRGEVKKEIDKNYHETKTSQS